MIILLFLINVLSSVAKHVCWLMFLPTGPAGFIPDTEFCQKWESLLMTTYYWTGFHVLTRHFSENGSPCCDTPPHKNWSPREDQASSEGSTLEGSTLEGSTDFPIQSC
jgi:hypothetical protein